MSIGRYAYLEEEDNREDPLYEWVRSQDLDERDGRPSIVVIDEARNLGIDVEKVVERERTPEEQFDPLTRSQTQSVGGVSRSHWTQGTSSSSRTRSDRFGRSSDNDDDDDATSGGGGRSEGGGGVSQSQRPLSPFTGEADYTHATQDTDHGARPQMQMLARRKGKGPREADTLTESLASVDLSSTGAESSYTNEDASQMSSSYGYMPSSWGDMRLIPEAGSCWSSSPHDLYHPPPPTQPPSHDFIFLDLHPYGYASGSSTSHFDFRANDSSSYNMFGSVNPYEHISGYAESSSQHDNDDDVVQPPRHSLWY